LTEAGVFSFGPLSPQRPLRLDYRRTQIPPKKYLFPFREEILRFRDGSYHPGPLEPPALVLFGVHACDLHGIAYLDRVFLSDRPDPSYAARRARLTLVGISCTPDDSCFCSEGQHGAPCDLFLDARNDQLLVSAATPKGEAVAAAAAELLTPTDKPAPATGEAGCFCPPQDPQLRFSEHPLWQRFAETCVSCGACSVCCPTCYCFDLREYPELSGEAGRLREWDNCLLATHGEVAGKNFRPDRLDRLRYRFLHKYCGFSPLEGMSSCVGCGRCKEVCPVDIDLRELFDQQCGATR
jgi:ferredoxin